MSKLNKALKYSNKQMNKGSKCVCILVCIVCMSSHAPPIQLGMELFHCARALGTVKHSMALGPSSI